MNRWTRIFLATAPFLALAIFAAAALAETVDDYASNLPVCVSNDSGETLTRAPFPATVNADELADGGFVQNDFEDLFAVNANSLQVHLLAQDVASTSAVWWVEADSIADGATRCWEVHIGNSTETRDQGLLLRGETEMATISDSASLDVTSDLSVEVMSVTLSGFASSGAYLTGGTLTETHEFREHSFGSTDTLTVIYGGQVNYLCVAGGGGGGSAEGADRGSGGGGAGEVQQGTVTIDSDATVTVGAGGAGGSGVPSGGEPGDPGQDSSIGGLVTCVGGGQGGGGGGANLTGGDGGSGGGAGAAEPSSTSTGGSSTATGDGNDGGASDAASGQASGGGGGGAGGVGAAGVAGSSGGDGGDGVSVDLPSGTVIIGGGGGGGCDESCTGGSGGTGGGASGGANDTAGANASGNTGGGGGGAGHFTGGGNAGGSGGSGRVVVWYDTAFCLVCKEDAYRLYVYGDTLAADVYIGSSATTVEYGPIADDTEYNFAMRYDGADLSLLVDGATVSVDSATGSIDTNSNDVIVGNGPFIAEIGRVMVHDASGSQLDSTSNGNDGTAASPLGTVGPSSSVRDGLLFDADDDVVTIPDDAAIQNVCDGGCTWEFWVNPSGEGEEGNGRVGVKGNVWELFTHNETAGDVGLRFIYRFDSNIGGWNLSSSIIPIGQWSHVAITYNSSGTGNDPTFTINATDVYTVGDGLTEADTPVGTRLSDAGDDIRIGNRDGGTDRTFDGAIADFRLWSDVRTAMEISENYDSRLTGSEAGLAGYWQLGNAVLDLDFEPAQLSETQQGSSGNSWTWLGDAEDQSSSNNDGVYTFVRPYVASSTVDVQALIVKAPLPTVLIETETPDTIGSVPGLTGKESPASFPGRGILQTIVDLIGGPADAAEFSWMALLGIGLGALSIKVSHYPAVGFVVLGAIIGIGGPFGLYDWMLPTIVALACFGVAGAMLFAAVRYR